ncbi:MAG: hypothetical protein WDM71_04480 [Ferruginibacter sp.]
MAAFGGGFTWGSNIGSMGLITATNVKDRRK